VYVGNAGAGFTEAEIDSLLERMAPLETERSPFTVPPRDPRLRKGKVVWLEPVLVAEVEFAEWTHDGRVRAPAYKGLREDRATGEARAELPDETEIGRGRRRVRLTGLNRLLWRAAGIRKGDLVEYYAAVAPALLPHLRDRPFTMKRYFTNVDGPFVWEKDAPPGMPDWIPTAELPAKSRAREERKTVRYPLVNDELALLWMVEYGCVDLHLWYSRRDRASRPDYVLFDLDPSSDVGFAQTVDVAFLVREALAALGLECFVKTSGGEGLHVVLPIERRYTYADTREFAEVVGRALERTHAGLVTTQRAKARRRGVLVDAKQNGEGMTIASVYSVRPRPGAPVSAPVAWDELSADLDPRELTMDVVTARVERDGDLFEPVLSTRQRLEPALRRLR
jgi:bifunctional non-homologous end joining protein LigD